MTGIWIEKLPRGGGRLIAVLAAATLLAFAGACASLIPVGQAQAQTVPLKYAIEINVQAGTPNLGVVQFEDENGNWIQLGQGETRTVMVDAGDDFAVNATSSGNGQFDFIKFDGALMDIGPDQKNWTDPYDRVLYSVDRNHRYDFAFMDRSAPFGGIPDTIGEDGGFTVGMAYRVTGNPAFGEWVMKGLPLVKLYDDRIDSITDGSVWIRALQPGTTTARYGEGNSSPTPKDVAITIGANTTNEHYIFALAYVGGQIDLPGNQKVTEGESKTFTVMPDNGYWIEEVWVDGSRLTLTDAERKGNYAHTFTNVQGPHDIVATFEEAGELKMVDSLEGYEGETILNVKPNPNYGAWIYDDEYVDIERRLEGADWVFDLHLKKEGTTLLTYKVKNMEKTIQLKINKSHIVKASAGLGGAISPAGDVYVRDGADQTFTITPDAGFLIDKVMVDGTDDVAKQLQNGTYTFAKVKEGHTIEATFKGVPIGNLPSSCELFVGESTSLSPTPGGGTWAFDSSALALVEEGGVFTFTGLKASTTKAVYTVNGVSREVSFTVKPVFAIVAKAGEGGTISPSGNVLVKSGADQAFTVKPNAGYRLKQLLVDGADATVRMEGTVFTFEKVTADHVIEATFEPIVAPKQKLVGTGDSALPLGALGVAALAGLGVLAARKRLQGR